MKRVALLVVMLAGLTLACLLSSGCWPLMPSTRTDSGEASGALRSWEYDPDTGKWLGVEKTMTVVGPSGKTSQEGGAQAIKTGALKFKMDGMEAEGPKFGIQAEGWEGTLANPVTIMSIIGGLAIIGAGAYWWFTRDLMTAGIIAATGLGLLVCAYVFESYPIVILGLFLAALVGIGYYLWERYKGKTNAEVADQVAGVLALVTRAVEKVGKTNPTAAEAVKDAVAEKAEENPDLDVKTIISDAKGK